MLYYTVLLLIPTIIYDEFKSTIDICYQFGSILVFYSQNTIPLQKKNVALITNKHFPFPHLVFLFFFKFASARMCSPSLLLIEIISVNPPGFNCIFFFVCFVFPFIMLVIAGSYGLIRISSKASF